MRWAIFCVLSVIFFLHVLVARNCIGARTGLESQSGIFFLKKKLLYQFAVDPRKNQHTLTNTKIHKLQFQRGEISGIGRADIPEFIPINSGYSRDYILDIPNLKIRRRGKMTELDLKWNAGCFDIPRLGMLNHFC